MPSDKAPAFQVYPKDYESDEAVKLMSLEQEGAYWRLLLHQWINGSVPDNVEHLALICRTSTKRMAALWCGIACCFQETEMGRLANPRLERQRAEQDAYRTERAASGQKGASHRWGKAKPQTPDGSANSSAIQEPLANDSSPSPSATAITTTTPVGGKDPEGPDEPARPPAESLLPLQRRVLAELERTAKALRRPPDVVLAQASRLPNGSGVMVNPLNVTREPWLRVTEEKLIGMRLGAEQDRASERYDTEALPETAERAELKRFLDTHGAPAALAEKALAWAASNPPAEGTETEAQLAVRWLTAIEGPRIAGAMISTAISFARKRRRTA